MNPDWNWFFSSTAQSAAAIVGIFAAFVITKIINNQSSFSRRVQEIETLCIRSKKLCQASDDRHFGWYNRWVRESEMYNLYHEARRADQLLPAEQYYANSQFSPFDPKAEVLEAIREKLRKVKEDRETGMNSLAYRPIMPETFSEERDKIESLRADVIENVRTISTVLGSVSSNPESSKLISFSIVAVSLMFYIGVIYPLSLLPWSAQTEISLSFSAVAQFLFSLKGLILTCIALIYTTIMTVFVIINGRLRYDSDKIEELKKYTQLRSYSPFFANLDENQQTRK